ncbi:hypothetical protein BDR07DRAFT_1275808 [Suillus spraguei]|nr:hypothetical protein BDR07DRAFT_1275808 [Suillus spraguei]
MHSNDNYSRYQAENLLICFMTPGPKEPTRSQLQNYMRLIVDDLLQLYDEGVIYHTPAYPQGKSTKKLVIHMYTETICRSKGMSCLPWCCL